MTRLHIYYVYIMASGKYGTLYTGVTNSLLKRDFEHKHKTHKGFTARYNITQLVYYEEYNDIREAIAREKSYQKMAARLDDVIEKFNPEWRDLSLDAT